MNTDRVYSAEGVSSMFKRFIDTKTGNGENVDPQVYELYYVFMND